MLIPSVDILGGQAVQMVGARELALELGDPRPWVERFGVLGEVDVMDLDAALGQGSNADLIKQLLPLARCRVGGGIRSYEAAAQWLEAGAARVVLGTAAEPSLLSRLPRRRVIASLAEMGDQVMVDGWRRGTGRGVAERMAELAPHVGGFLVHFVELGGRMEGTSLERAASLRGVAGEARVTVAGGISSCEEVAHLDRLGIDAQVGMALYTNRIELHEAVACLMRPDPPWATVVTDPYGAALGLVWSNRESLKEALAVRQGVYHSRSRGLWRKGETSGNRQELLEILPDCDRDALRFRVRQQGVGFCHVQTPTCWGDDRGLQRLARRLAIPRPGGYTERLLTEDGLLAAKLREEAGELAEARGEDAVAWEAADLLYFTMVALQRQGVSLERVVRELERRELRP